ERTTQENGSGWAAQRLGGRRDVWRLRETAERAPIASTPVASRCPVVQLTRVVFRRAPVVA
ncbi:MAG: hypothetical protein JSU89_02210, partial [Myxococcales bacterium]